MRPRKTTDSKEQCMDKITGKHNRQQAINKLIDVNKEKSKKKKIFVSSKTVFPKEKEFFLEVDKSLSKKQIAEKITKRMQGV